MRISDWSSDVCSPDLRFGIRPSLVVPDRQEPFLEGMRLPKLGKLREPCHGTLHVRSREVVLALEQQEPFVLELEPLPSRHALADLLAQLLQGVIGHPLDMEAIDHDPRLR